MGAMRRLTSLKLLPNPETDGKMEYEHWKHRCSQNDYSDLPLKPVIDVFLELAKLTKEHYVTKVML